MVERGQENGEDAGAAGLAAAEMPIFYRQPRALEPGRYGGKSLREVTRYEFARATNSVALNAAEFAPAMASYPIVFTARAPLAALAVLGLRDRENLFIEADGSWRADCYIPAYVRRYPFIFMRSPKGDQFILCVDDRSELIIEGESQPFFVDGQPAKVIERALAFCGEYQTGFVVTQDFVAALEKNDLLARTQIQFADAGGAVTTLGGFRVVDEAKLNALPDGVFLDWRRRGWLGLIYRHLASLANWPRLGQLAKRG
jgi:hypothetical protein